MAFSSVISKIQPSNSELSTLEASRKHLVAFLSNRIETSKFLLMGSHSRGTAIKNSDLDLLQVIRKRELTWGGSLVSSSTVLNNVRSHLSNYGKTDVRRDNQALVVRYTSGHHIDLVPGFYRGPGVSNYPIYEIPDGSGGWLQTSPEAHNAYLKLCDERAGGKLKRTVQLVKYWRKCRSVEIPLNSFHLEIVLANSRVCEGPKSYSSCVQEAFRELAAREARALRDPIGVSGLISASATDAQKLSVANSLTSSAEHALKAKTAETYLNSSEALRQWRIVFNGGI